MEEERIINWDAMFYSSAPASVTSITPTLQTYRNVLCCPPFLDLLRFSNCDCLLCNIYKMMNYICFLEVRCRGVIDKRNALTLETICNLVGIKAQQRLKGALARIALLGSYRIYLARKSPEWSGGELISVS